MLRIHAARPPAPPGAGLTKIADPRAVLRGWLIFLAALAVAVAVAWPLGLRATVDTTRRQFVARGYVDDARQAIFGRPVRREAALAALHRALQVAPRDEYVTRNAARLFIEARAYSEAVPLLEQQQSPADLLAQVSLGQCLLLTGRADRGEALLLQALQQVDARRQARQMPDAAYVELLNYIGYVHALAGTDLSQARGLIQAALTLGPQRPEVTDSLGWVEYRLGNHLDAAFYLERAVRLYLPQESAEVYYHLGAAYARLGRKYEAGWCLARCLHLDPSWDEAREELEQLGQDLPHPAFAARPVGASRS